MFSWLQLETSISLHLGMWRMGSLYSTTHCLLTLTISMISEANQWIDGSQHLTVFTVSFARYKQGQKVLKTFEKSRSQPFQETSTFLKRPLPQFLD